jgi:hypothetical protein
MGWQRLPAWITVEHGLMLRHAYPAVEDRTPRQHIDARLPLNDGGRKALAKMGRQALRIGHGGRAWRKRLEMTVTTNWVE